MALQATHDEAPGASNDSCPRLGCKLRGRRSAATVSDGCAHPRARASRAKLDEGVHKSSLCGIGTCREDALPPIISCGLAGILRLRASSGGCHSYEDWKRAAKPWRRGAADPARALRLLRQASVRGLRPRRAGLHRQQLERLPGRRRQLARRGRPLDRGERPRSVDRPLLLHHGGQAMGGARMGRRDDLTGSAYQWPASPDWRRSSRGTDGACSRTLFVYLRQGSGRSPCSSRSSCFTSCCSRSSWPVRTSWRGRSSPAGRRPVPLSRPRPRAAALRWSLLMFVWANIHGSYFVGFIVAAASRWMHCIDARWSRAVVLAGSCSASAAWSPRCSTPTASLASCTR